MKITNKYNLPAPFVNAVKREYQYKEKRYSVTSILKGTCQTILERRYHDKIVVDVSDMIWMIFGNAVHSILENSEEELDQLKENKFAVKVGDYTLSGIFDLYDDKEKCVTDYKTGSVWRVIYDDWDDYYLQILIYAWMLRQIGFDCNKGQIIMILKDFNQNSAKYEADYPKKPVFVREFKFKASDFKFIDKFIKKKFRDIKKCELLVDCDLPPCNEIERWAKYDKYAVMRKGRKSAIRVFDEEFEARLYMYNLGNSGNLYIQKRKGTDTKCENYCLVNKWCPYYKKTHEFNRKTD